MDVLLDSIDSFAEDVVLQVEKLEASMDVLDKLADLNSKLDVAQGDGIDGQSGKLVCEGSDC